MSPPSHAHCPECLLRGDLGARLAYDGPDHNKLLCPSCGESYGINGMFFRFMEVAVKLAEIRQREAKEHHHEHAAD